MIRTALFLLGIITTVKALELPVEMLDKQPIEIGSGLLGKTYKQDGKNLNFNSVNLVLEKYPECREDIASVKSLLALAFPLSAIGGVLIGYPIGLNITGDKFNYPLFYSGLGTVTIGMTLSIIADKKRGRAIQKYNGLLSKSSFQLFLTPAHQAFAIQTPF